MAEPVMTLPRNPKSSVAAGRSPSTPVGVRGHRRESVTLFLVAVLVYAVVGGLMSSHNVIFADAMSRVGNADYVLYSRYPHLPALGYVWNPLPSLVLLPLLPLKFLWPELITLGLAGVVQSVLCMAGTVVVLSACLRKLSVPTVPRLALIAVFGLEPMILLYAGSGLSEPMFMLFLAITVSQLLSWVGDRSAGSLVGAGLALGGAYLTRYEAVAPAAAVALSVAGLTCAWTAGPRRHRWSLAVNNLALVAGPFLLTFVMWAVMAKIIVGEWLPTFTSAYGNSAQVTSGAGSIRSVIGDTPSQVAAYVGRQIVGLAPIFFLLLVVVIVVAIRRRDWRAMSGPLVFGAVLAFDELAALSGLSFGWLRFQIMVIPLSVLLAGSLIASLSTRRASAASGGPAASDSSLLARLTPNSLAKHRRSAQVVATAFILAAFAAAIPTQTALLVNTRSGLAREESPMLRSLLLPTQASHEERRSLQIFVTERGIASTLDQLHLPAGSVLTDTAYAYSVVMSSRNPRQFVITSDLDFAGAVSDPAGHHIQYLLVPAPNLGPADALRKQWPSLYRDGAGIATLVRTYSGKFFGDWRLYRVTR